MAPACDMTRAAGAGGPGLGTGNHPVLRWCMSNAVVSTDAAGNRKLDKSRAFGRIDAAVAALMAITAARLADRAAQRCLGNDRIKPRIWRVASEPFNYLPAHNCS